MCAGAPFAQNIKYILRMASIFGGLVRLQSCQQELIITSCVCCIKILHALRFSFRIFGFKEWSRLWEEDVVYVRPPWGSQAPLMRGKPTYDKQDSEDSKYWSSRFPCWVLLALSWKKQMKSTDKLSWPVN